MSHKFKISVIMGIYNCQDTLAEAIDSLLAQTFQDFELIMCDDGSSDNSKKIAEDYCNRFPDRFVLLENVENLGLNKTLNNCLKVATGEYVARMDGDDISLPDRFEKEVNFLDSHKEYAIVSTPMIFFDENGDWGSSKSIEIPQIKDFVFHTPFHCHAPCMIRREAYCAVNGYTEDKRLLRFEDCNLWFKLYGAGYRGYNIQEPLYKMRDDKNAYKRRKASVRLRGTYVKWTGFRIVKMPLKYYPFLIVEFMKNLAIAIMPEKLYNKLRRSNKETVNK